jgi:hypothetical protein
MNKEFKEIIKKYLPSEILNFLIDSSYARKKNTNGLTIKKRESFFDIYDANKRCVRVSRMHNIYIQDIIDSFDYYFLAVKPIEINELHLVDYSTPRLHEVIGYELHPIMFSSFAEPLNTTKQYLEFAQLTNGSVALDLGAYSGLTSILFDRMVGNTGRVISVEADESNIKCVKTNFGLYNN